MSLCKTVTRKSFALFLVAANLGVIQSAFASGESQVQCKVLVDGAESSKSSSEKDLLAKLQTLGSSSFKYAQEAAQTAGYFVKAGPLAEKLESIKAKGRYNFGSHEFYVLPRFAARIENEFMMSIKTAKTVEERENALKTLQELVAKIDDKEFVASFMNRAEVDDYYAGKEHLELNDFTLNRSNFGSTAVEVAGYKAKAAPLMEKIEAVKANMKTAGPSNYKNRTQPEFAARIQEDFHRNLHYAKTAQDREKVLAELQGLAEKIDDQKFVENYMHRASEDDYWSGRKYKSYISF